MIKFNAFPPEPGDIEWALGSGMTIREAERIGRLAPDAYRDNGAMVGHLLVANMISPTWSRISSALEHLFTLYPLTNDGVRMNLTMGAMNAQFMPEEVSHV